eukprot:3382733-Pyramimonas_sp.AAC.1
MPEAGPGSRMQRLHLAGTPVDRFQKIGTVYDESSWASRVFQGLREALKFREGPVWCLPRSGPQASPSMAPWAPTANP